MLSPKRAGSPVDGAQALHLGSAQTRLERLSHGWQQGLHRVAHLGEEPVAQTVAAGFEQVRQAPQGEGSLSQLRLEEPPGIGDGQGLVDEAERPVQVVFFQVRQEHVGLVDGTDRPMDDLHLDLISTQLLEAVGAAWSVGAKIEWQGLRSGPLRRVPLRWWQWVESDTGEGKP